MKLSPFSLSSVSITGFFWRGYLAHGGSSFIDVGEMDLYNSQHWEFQGEIRAKKIKNLQEPYKKPPILNPSMHIHSTPESQTKFHDVVCSLGKISKWFVVNFSLFVQFPALRMPSTGPAVLRQWVEISTHMGTQVSRWRCFSVFYQDIKPEAIRDAEHLSDGC